MRREEAAAEHHPDDWLSRSQAATYSCRSVDTIDRAIKTGRLKSTKTDGRVAIRRRWVDAYLLLALVEVAATVILLIVGLLGLLILACIAGLEPAHDAVSWLCCARRPS